MNQRRMHPFYSPVKGWTSAVDLRAGEILVMLGGYGKVPVGNANGKIGIGNDNLFAPLKGVADELVATAQAGLHYKDGFGIGAKAKASALSGRATTEFNIFGWQVELECVSKLNCLKEIE